MKHYNKSDIIRAANPILSKFSRAFSRKKHDSNEDFPDGFFDPEDIESRLEELSDCIFEYDLNLVLDDAAIDRLKEMKLRGPSSSERRWFEYADRLAKARVSEPDEAYDSDKILYRSLKRKFKEAFIPEDLSSSFIPAYIDYCQDQFASDRPMAYVLSGDPGCGKTESARLIGEISSLVTCYNSCTRLDEGHGINGETNTFSDGDIGVILRGLMQSANPMFIFDEPEKCPRPNNRASFADSMLTLLDKGSKQFIDNNFGYPVRANQCIFFFCVNEPNLLSAPLLDRCVHIEMPAPTRDRILGVTKLETEKILKRKPHIILPDEYIVRTVDKLCSDGVFSFREHSRVIENVIRSGERAYYESDLDFIEITNGDIDQVLKSRIKSKTHAIGF